MEKYQIIKKYNYQINEWAGRISNTYNVLAYHPGMNRGPAGYSVNAGKDTSVVVENCLKEIIDKVLNDGSIPDSEKEFCIKTINDEVLSRIKKNNVASGESAYRKEATNSVLEDFVGIIVIIFVIIGIIILFQ